MYENIIKSIYIYSKKKISWLDIKHEQYNDNHWRQYQCDHYNNDFDNDDEDDYKPPSLW